MNNSMNILQDISYWLNIKHCGKRVSVQLLQPYANNALIRHFKQQINKSDTMPSSSFLTLNLCIYAHQNNILGG